MAARNRRPATRPVKVGLQTEFEKHTESVYKGMQGRAKKMGREMPFTLREFREWLLAGPFKGSWDNAVQCAYCRAWLNALTFVPDHVEPVKYGGSFGLDNLTLCCQPDNIAKGVMSADGFKRLLEFSTQLHPQDSADMFGRMKNGAGFLRLKIQARGARAKTSKNFAMPPLLGGKF
jgi:hypothetical protein